VAEGTPGGSCPAETCADLTAGRKGARWPLGRFVIGDQELAVRSWLTGWWIPERSVSKAAVGEISVSWMIVVHLPVLRWRRVKVVGFGPGSTFADVWLSSRVGDELRRHGYSVVDEQ
jgi:hypothetical protein